MSTGRPARKVFTEAMIRRVLKKHFEIEPTGDDNIACECGWSLKIDPPDAFENHFIDQLHKLWHEMFSKPRRDSNGLTPTEVAQQIGEQQLV